MELKPLFKDIAGAIREKDGTTEEIKAADFPGRILAIPAGGVTVEKLEITAPPTKTLYFRGETFDPTGMAVWAELSNGYGVYVNHADLTFSPEGPLELGTDAVTVSFRWDKQVISTVQEIEVAEVPAVQIYGVEWDWDNGNSTKGTRTDASADFPEPSPAVNNGTGSSPFDNLMPWAGMVKETRAGGVEVKEPKYWFRWSKTGKKLKLQIADGPVEGFHVDPVNMDRGDGLGELDFSYIGRYHCATDNWKSETNNAPKWVVSRSAARTGIHGLGANFWQFDFAQYWYIGMLFLVEFADWNGERIGRGCSASGSRENNGKTDAMQYHTGTTAANRNTYGYTQYRNIEGWWDNVYDWMDGCYYNSNGLNVVTNPNQFSDSANGTLVGKPSSGAGYPSNFTIPTASGLEWALFPSAMSGSDTTYVPYRWAFDGSSPCLYHGGYFKQSQDHGPFYVGCITIAAANSTTGCRLQERPPKA